MRNYKELRQHAIYSILNDIEKRIEDGIKFGEEVCEYKIHNNDLCNDIKKYLTEDGYIVEDVDKNEKQYDFQGGIRQHGIDILVKYLIIKLNQSNYEN